MIKYKLNIAHTTSSTHGVSLANNHPRRLCHAELSIWEEGDTSRWPKLGKSCNACGHPQKYQDPADKNNYSDKYILSMNRLTEFEGNSLIVATFRGYVTRVTPELLCIAATTTALRYLITLLTSEVDILNIAKELSIVWRQYFLGSNCTTGFILGKCMEEPKQSIYTVKLQTFTVPSEQKPFGRYLEHCSLDIFSENGSLVFSLHPCLKKKYSEKSTEIYMDLFPCDEKFVRKIDALPPHPTAVPNYCQVAMIDLLTNIKNTLKVKESVNNVDIAIEEVCDMNVYFQSELYKLRGGTVKGVEFGDLEFGHGSSDEEEHVSKHWPEKLF